MTDNVSNTSVSVCLSETPQLQFVDTSGRTLLILPSSLLTGASPAFWFELVPCLVPAWLSLRLVFSLQRHAPISGTYFFYIYDSVVLIAELNIKTVLIQVFKDEFAIQ